MLIPSRLIRLLLVFLLALTLSACPFSSDSDKPPTDDDISQDDSSDLDDTDGDDEIPDTVQLTFADFLFTLEKDAFWEYRWDAKDQSYAQGSGTSTNSAKGRFRMTLGEPSMIAGVEGFPLQLSGNPIGADGDDAWDFTPRWKYLAVDETRLLASKDGATWETLFDAELGVWGGGGFFTTFPGDTLIVAQNGAIANDYLSASAIQVGRSNSQSQCETIVGITICGDESYDIKQYEYYQNQIGVVGYYYHSTSSFSGGGFYSSYTYDRNIGLVASSLKSDSVDYALETEPNNNFKNNAMTLSLPAKVRGDSNNETDYGGTSVFVNEIEPNDNFTDAQAISYSGEKMVGEVTDGDTAHSLIIPALNDGVYSTPEYTASFEDFYSLNMDSNYAVYVEMDILSKNADVDFYVFTLENGVPTIQARSIKDNLSKANYLESRSFNATAGKTYYIAIDIASSGSVKAQYLLKASYGTYGSISANANDVTDWYKFSLSDTRMLSITLTDTQRGVVLMNSDATQTLDKAIPSQGKAVVSHQLDSGDYLVGVTKGFTDKSGEYQLEITAQ